MTLGLLEEIVLLKQALEPRDAEIKEKDAEIAELNLALDAAHEGIELLQMSHADLKAKLDKVANFLIEEGSVVHNTGMMLRFREKCRELAKELNTNDNKKG